MGNLHQLQTQPEINKPIFQKLLLFLLGLVKVSWPNLSTLKKLNHWTQITDHMLRLLKVTLRILSKSRMLSPNCLLTRLLKYMILLLWQPLVKKPIVTQVINLKADIK